MREDRSNHSILAVIGERFIRSSHTFWALIPLIGRLFIAFPSIFLAPQSFNWWRFRERFISYGIGSLLIILVTNIFAIGFLVSISSYYLVLFKKEILIIDFIIMSLTSGITPLLISLIMLLRFGPKLVTNLYRMSPLPIENFALKEIWPRALALAAAMPMLYIYVFLASLFLGAFFGKYSYKISLSHYIDHLSTIFDLANFLTSLISCLIYGLEIVIVLNFYGIYYKAQNHRLSEALKIGMVTCLIILIGTEIFIVNFIKVIGIK